MTDLDEAAEFIQNFIKHEYDPVRAHEYYIRTRELKGRAAASSKPSGDPRAYRGSNGKPLRKLGSRLYEDELPETSPTGAKLTSFVRGTGLGKAVYSDGHVYDAKLGWVAPQPSIARANAAQSKLNQARNALKKAPPAQKAALVKKIDAAQKKLDAIKGSTKSRANQ